MNVAVLGATGPAGIHVVRELRAEGHAVVAAGRDPDRLRELGQEAATVCVDLLDHRSIARAVDGAEAVVSLAHARHAQTILAALPPTCRRAVFTGSTRAFTRFPDPAADAVREAETAVQNSIVPAIILHPTMIYGSGRDRNVSRLVAYALRWPRWIPPILPLPGGGRNLVQPLLVDDFAKGVAAAIRAERTPRSLILAGPEPMRYRDMAGAWAEAVGRDLRIVPVPSFPAIAATATLERVGLSLPVTTAMLRRFLEDRSFSIAPAAAALGFSPRPFAEGLRMALLRMRR